MSESTSVSSKKWIESNKINLEKSNALITDLLSKSEASIKEGKFNLSKKYLNLAKLVKPINDLDKIRIYVLYMISYSSLKDEKYLFYFVMKIMTKFERFYDNVPESLKHIIITTIYKYTVILHKKGNYIKELFFIKKLKGLREGKSKSPLINEDMVREISNRDHELYLRLSQEISLQKEAFLSNKYAADYDFLRRSFIDERYNLNLKDMKNFEMVHLISTAWVRTFFFFLLTVSKESLDESGDRALASRLFQFSKTFGLYFERNPSQEDLAELDPAFPGPVNNIFICGLCDYWFDPESEEAYTNEFLGDDQIENTDYQIVDGQTYSVLVKLFGEGESSIRRPVIVYENSEEKVVDVETRLLKYKVLILSRSFLVEDLTHLIKVRKIQISREKTVLEFKEKIIRCINFEIKKVLEGGNDRNNKHKDRSGKKNERQKDNNKYLFEFEKSKFHIVIPDFTSENDGSDKVNNAKNDTDNVIHSIVHCFYNKYSTYIEKIEGKEIKDENNLMKMDELKIGENDIIIIEVLNLNNKSLFVYQPTLETSNRVSLRSSEGNNQNSTNTQSNILWFINLKTPEDYPKCKLCSKPISGQIYNCPNCSVYIYCSSTCASNDEKHIEHHRILDSLYKKKFALHDFLSVNIQKVLLPGANMGKTGLKNLGNTCFMNSAIQCLSACEELTKYFLLRKFDGKLNTHSRTGSRGKIAKAYYSLMYEIWNGQKKYINPWDFRQIFVSFVKQFAGFSQQDSDEMLVFVLDQLHEDLNEVTTKPYIELEERYEMETEEEASLRWWKNHVDREKSIIVDLFHGQFKSVVRCPECKRVNMIYDAFMNLGLPIPVPQAKIRVKLIYEKKDSVNVILYFYNCNEKTTLREIESKLDDDISKMEKNNEKLYEKIGESRLRGIVVDKYKRFQKLLENENELIMDYYKNEYEIIFYKVVIDSKMKNPFSVIVSPVALAEDKKNESHHKNLFYPKIFVFSQSSSIREMYFSFFVYYLTFFGQNKFTSLASLKSSNIMLNNTFSDNFSSEESSPFHLYIVNNLPKRAKFPCEFCNRSCKYCAFSFSFSDPVRIMKKTQKIERPFLLMLETRKEALDYINMFSENDPPTSEFHRDLMRKSRDLSIYDCFEAFRTEERLEKENAWYCKTCKKNQEAFKKLEIYRAPNILILQLKRFDCKTENFYEGITHNKKNDSFVDFPIKDLDLTKYVVEENSRKDSIYDLCAISQHYGTLSSGHYTAICKNENEWYNFDDEKVSKIVNERNIVTKYAYILIYRKKNLCS